MEVDHIDGIQSRLMSILDGIVKVRNDLDLDKKELKSDVKKIGSEVNKIEKSFRCDGLEIVDVILEEVKFIKEEMRSGREEVKSELKKLGKSVEKLEKKCRKISGGSGEPQDRLTAALEAAKLAEEKLEEEKRKNNSSMELIEKMKGRERELEKKLENWEKINEEMKEVKQQLEEAKKKLEDCSGNSQVTFTDSKKSREMWQIEGSGGIIKDYKVSEVVRAVEFNSKEFIDENQITRRRVEPKKSWGWLEKQEDRMTNIVIKGLEVEENKIVEQVNEFIDRKLNAPIKVLAGKYFFDQKKERTLLVKLESEEDVEEVMRRHKLGKDGIFIDYAEMTPPRELRKQLKTILERNLKHVD